jgi:FkbM family methyltransferase
MVELTVIADTLAAPLSSAEIIGFYKIVAAQHSHANLKYVLDIAEQYNFNPKQVYLNFLDIPEISSALNADLIRQYSFPVPIKLNFGAVVFGFVWDSFITDVARRTGAWEPELQAQISRYLKPGDVALDIGGNIGCHAALMATLVGEHGAVHTFEPISYNIDALNRMKDINKFSCLTVHPVAASAKNEILQISPHATNSGGNSIVDDASLPGLQFVRAVSLDSYMSNLDRLDFIKMDIEGHEGSALEGAVEILTRFQPTVIMELTPGNLRKRGNDPVAVVQRFFDAGLTVEVIGCDLKFLKSEDVVNYVETRAPYMDIIAKRAG